MGIRQQGVAAGGEMAAFRQKSRKKS